MTSRDSYIKLCNIPELPNDYSHTYDFVSKLSQEDFFEDQARLHFRDIQYIKKDQSIKVPISYDSIKTSVNYCFFCNGVEPIDNKIYYAFINDMEYVNENTTKLYLQLDIIQTYLFDFNLKPSYVDRMHVDRWNRDGTPSREVEPEDLDFGEHIQIDREVLHKYNDQYLMVSSNPLGFIVQKAGPGGITWFPPAQTIPLPDPLPPEGGAVPEPQPPTPGGGQKPPPKPPTPKPSGACWKQKQPSKELVRFVKGFEGYAKFKYRDSGGHDTIGYGCTASDQPSFNQLIASQPVGEQKCSEVLYKDLCRDQYAGKVYEKMIKWKLDKQYQFDALLSFTYNAGSKWLDESNTLPSYIQNHQWDKVRERWPNYIVYDDQVPPQKQPGLVARRTEEMHMFFGEEYEVRKIPNVGQNGRPDGSYVTENQGNGYLGMTNCEQGGYDSYPTPDPLPPGTGPVPGSDPTIPVRKMGDSWILNGMTVYAPCTGKITATWPKYSSGRFHSGMDIGANKGELIYSPFYMRIEQSKDLSVQENDPSGSFGRYVQGRILTKDGHDTNYKVWFAHMSSRWVEVGDKVRPGNILGQVGSTGNSTGPHCHFEIREHPWNYGGTPQNTDSINPKPGAVVGQFINGPRPINWEGGK